MTAQWIEDPKGDTCPKCGSVVLLRGGAHYPIGREDDPIVITQWPARCPQCDPPEDD